MNDKVKSQEFGVKSLESRVESPTLDLRPLTVDSETAPLTLDSVDKLLDALKNQKPKVEDEESFVDEIMGMLPDEEPSVSHDSPLIILVRTISSIAAVIVIGWFVFLNMESKPSESHGGYGEGYNHVYSEYDDCNSKEEVIRLYFQRKNNNINNLITLYDE